MKQDVSRSARRIARLLGVLLTVFLGGWLVLLGLGISIPVNVLRYPVAAALSRELGQEVRIDGALVLRPGVYPTIVAHDLHIAGSPGGEVRLQADRVALQLAPHALLGGSPQVVRILIEDTRIDLNLEQAANRDGSALEADSTAPAPFSRLLDSAAALLSAQPGLREIVLRGVALNLRAGHPAWSRQTEFDKIKIHGQPGNPLEVRLRGQARQRPYKVDLTGGPPEDLLAKTQSWPFRAAVSVEDLRLQLRGELDISGAGLATTFGLSFDWHETSQRTGAGFALGPLSGRLFLYPDQGRPLISGELQLPAPDAVLRVGEAAGPVPEAASPATGNRNELAGKMLALPLAVSIADTVFHGRLAFSGDVAAPLVGLSLSATDASVPGLLRTLTGRTGIHGQIGRLGLQASIGADSGAALPDRLAVRLQLYDAALVYGEAAGQRTVALSLEDLVLNLPRGEAGTLTAHGTLRGVPFSARLVSGGLRALLAESRLPLKLSASGAGAALDISGSLAAGTGNRATHLKMELHGKRIGDLSDWLGVSPCAETAYTLQGQLILAGKTGRLQFLQMQTNDTLFTGDLDWSADDEINLMHAKLYFDALHPADIELFLPLVKNIRDNGVAGGISIDMPVLPAPLGINNADIDLVIAKVTLELIDASRVSLNARLRNGRMQRSAFHAHLGDISIQGYLDPSPAETTVVFEDEDGSNAGLSWLNELGNNAVRWVGNNATVPLRWFFKEQLFGNGAPDCQIRSGATGGGADPMQ